MNDQRRALTLTIDANSALDLQMLLKQALYEIEQLLPLPPDSSSEQVARSAYKTILSPSLGGERTTKGHTQGSLGSYEFSFVHSSREFKALEDQLLEQGYKLQTNGHSFFGKESYTHPTLPAKVIAGEPLAITDKPLENADGW